MSVLFSQNIDTVKTNMQEHNRYAISIQTVVVGEVVETSKSRTRARDHPPPLPNQNDGNRHGTTSRLFQIKMMETGTEPPPASSKSNLMPQKVSGTGPHPSSPKNANVGSSSETSTVLQRYEELQSVLDELDDDEKELRQQIMKDAEAHLEPTDYCLFEQLPLLWKQIPKKDDSSDGFYKLLTRTPSLTSNQWIFIHSSSSLPHGAKHEKSRPNPRLRVETPPPLLLYYNAKIRSLLL
ncbi:hypothetical protein P9112_002157 [Eukaryota sp. TZLM1-RC]